MSRIRSIHPGQWTDDEFLSCSLQGRLLALALRNEADDNGVFEWKPTQLKVRLMPADPVDVGELLEELVEHRIIAGYMAGGRRYGIVRNFTHYQSPRRPTALYPLPQSGAVADEFLVVVPNAEPRGPKVDPRQRILPLMSVVADNTPAQTPIPDNVGTCSDNVRPEKEEDIVHKDSLSKNPQPSESVAARASAVEAPEGKAFSQNVSPCGRQAPLPLEADGPVLKEKKKEQLRMKVFRFARATMTPAAFAEATAGLFSEDETERQTSLDTLDRKMRAAGWDDKRVAPGGWRAVA